MDEGRADMIATAVGRVVIELSAHEEQVTKELIIEMLEFHRRITGNLFGKGIYRDAAEIVRTGKMPRA